MYNRPPPGDRMPPEWEKVMIRARLRCECEAAKCAGQHNGTRCERVNAYAKPLAVAPADPGRMLLAQGGHPSTVGLPADDMLAYCPACFDGRLAIARREAKLANLRLVEDTAMPLWDTETR